MASDTASLLKLFLPDFILEHFDFKGIIVDEETFNIELEELNNPPSEWDGIKVNSNGFFPEIVVQDFPIRGHKVFLHIRRRRWQTTSADCELLMIRGNCLMIVIEQ